MVGAGEFPGTHPPLTEIAEIPASAAPSLPCAAVSDAGIRKCLN